MFKSYTLTNTRGGTSLFALQHSFSLDGKYNDRLEGKNIIPYFLCGFEKPLGYWISLRKTPKWKPLLINIPVWGGKEEQGNVWRWNGAVAHVTNNGSSANDGRKCLKDRTWQLLGQSLRGWLVFMDISRAFQVTGVPVSNIPVKTPPHHVLHLHNIPLKGFLSIRTSVRRKLPVNQRQQTPPEFPGAFFVALNLTDWHRCLQASLQVLIIW